ncbi:MAG: hypothetical protein Q4F00_06535 [bacterium]|nr:hypothetical protein [bacterium]
MFNQVSKKSRGFALALSLFLIVILATVCFAALNITTLDNRAATEDYKASRAFYAARAGVAYAKAQLTDSANVSLTSVLRYNEHLQLADGYISEEKFSITITPAVDNPARAFRIWKVESTGYYSDAARKIIAYLERETFAHYAYFTDRETCMSSIIQFMGQDKITGAVHTNGFFTIADHPQIGGQMVSANSGDTSYNKSTGVYKRTDSKDSTDNKDFYHSANKNYTKDRAIALDDSPDFSFAGGQAEVPLPRTTSSEIIEASKMADTSFKGNYRIVFTEDGKAKYYKQVTAQGRTYYEGYPPHNNGKDKPEKTLDTTVRPGITMYVDGNVEIDGKVLGRCTLSSSGDTYICDDLQYVNPSNCVLGILSEKNIIVRADPNVKQDFYIDAILMALNGSFTVENYNTGVDRGELHVFGGIVQNKRGPVGQTSTQTQSYYGGYYTTTKHTGYAKDYVYDHKLETMPPLNFPYTGKFVIRYFIDKGSLGGV